MDGLVARPEDGAFHMDKVAGIKLGNEPVVLLHGREADPAIKIIREIDPGAGKGVVHRAIETGNIELDVHMPHPVAFAGENLTAIAFLIAAYGRVTHVSTSLLFFLSCYS